jgi:SRSO17 transposase
VLEHLADPGAVLVVDETGDLKHGTATVGTQRQYTGTAGRTENAQVAVYLAYAAPAGCAFIDRALYLPRSWTCDPVRCRAAGVPADTVFATKPAQATTMITRALDAGAPVGWATAD